MCSGEKENTRLKDERTIKRVKRFECRSMKGQELSSLQL